MRERANALIGALLFLFVTSFAPAGAQQNAHIHGVVLDSASGLPLAKVAVSVIGTDVKTTTGQDGRFDVEVPPDTYVLQMTLAGYVVTQTDPIDATAANDVTIGLDPSRRPRTFS